MMNYEDVKRIREKISCPQLGDDHYGEWGALNLNQRIAIKELLDFVDAQENYIKSLQTKIEEVREVAEKQIPKKPVNKTKCDNSTAKQYKNCSIVVCPLCNGRLRLKSKGKHCDKCGQALDWSDT